MKKREVCITMEFLVLLVAVELICLLTKGYNAYFEQKLYLRSIHTAPEFLYGFLSRPVFDVCRAFLIAFPISALLTSFQTLRYRWILALLCALVLCLVVSGFEAPYWSLPGYLRYVFLMMGCVLENLALMRSKRK